MPDASGMFAPLPVADAAAPSPPRPPKGQKTPIIPVPADAPPCRFKHPKHGEPTKAWPYHDVDGNLVGYVCRWEFAGEAGERDKLILPVTFCDLGNGQRGWRSAGVPTPRPLHSLPDIIARPDAFVLITEGEKARDAGAILFPDMVATTPMHGAKSPQKTDFLPCAGRVVVIATDNDKPGQDFGDKVCELVTAAGAARVLHLGPDRLGSWLWRDGERVLRDGPIPDGWDIADALDDGWTANAVTANRDSDPDFFAPYQNAATRQSVAAFFGGNDQGEGKPRGYVWPFRLVANGVEKLVIIKDKETGTETEDWRWFCSPLEVTAETRDELSENWGRLLAVTDRDSKVKDWAMPMNMLAGDGTAYREQLLNIGLIIAPGRFARDALHEYISTARPVVKALCVAHVGWHGRVMVLPDETIGETER